MPDYEDVISRKGLDFDLETALKMAAATVTITLSSYDHEGR